MLPELNSRSRSSRGSVTPSNRSHSRQSTLIPPRVFASRSSIASSTLSRGSGRGVHVSLKHKRGVSFSHARKRSETSQKRIEGQTSHISKLQNPKSESNGGGIAANTTTISPAALTSYAWSKKTAAVSPTLRPARKQDCSTRIWHEDFRQLSTSLAKTCDEAFNRTSAVSSTPTKVSGLEESHNEVFESSVSSFDQTVIHYDSPSVTPLQPKLRNSSLGDRASWNSRPLPPPPTRSESVKKELAEARQMVQLRKLSGNDSPGYLDRLTTHIDQLMQPPVSPLLYQADRRIVSAPATSKHQEASKQLPSIHESNREESSSSRSSGHEDFTQRERVKLITSSRVISAPEPRFRSRSSPFDFDDRTPKQDDCNSKAIRAIQTSDPSPAKPPAPLNIRKKCSAGPPLMSGGNGNNNSRELPPKFDLRQQYVGGSRKIVSRNHLDINMQESPTDDVFAKISAIGPVKKSNWFKRSSKSREDARSGFTVENKETEDELLAPSKKKGFGLGRLFGRRSLRQEKGLHVTS